MIAIGAAFLAIACCGCGRFGFDAMPTDGAPGDAIANDAAIEDSSSTDAADSNTSVCDRLFCNSFDDGLDGWDGTKVEGASSATYDAMFGRTGGSLRAVSPSGTSIAALYEDVFTPVPTNIYIRAYIFAPSTQMLDTEPVEIRNGAGTHQIVFGIFDDSMNIHAHGMAADFTEDSLLAAPRDRWVCFVLHVEVAAAGRVELFMDGTSVISRSGLDTRPPSGDLSRVLVGIASKPTSLANEVHVDDVVADTSPIACE